MKYLMLLAFLSGCAIQPRASIASWNGTTGKVRQNAYGPFHEQKALAEMQSIMSEKCPAGFDIIGEGSDITAGWPAPLEIKYKEFKCK